MWKQSMNEEDYDVVIDTLQKKIDALWKMTKSNMDNDMMNIMDDIRLKQIDELKKAIELWLWKERK
jgi:virulence-associated protein VagC